MQTVGVYRIKGNDSCVLKHRCSHFHNSQLQTGKGNKTLFRIFKHGRLFWVMGERLSERHAMMNRWYVSVLVSEQTRSEEDYGSINLCWRKKSGRNLSSCCAQSTVFPPKVLPSLMRQLVARGEEVLLGHTVSAKTHFKGSSRLSTYSHLSFFGSTGIRLQINLSSGKEFGLSVMSRTRWFVCLCVCTVFVQFSDEWNYFQKKKVGQWKCRLSKGHKR